MTPDMVAGTPRKVQNKGLRIDYRQEATYKCSPDDSFSGKGWKTLFEYDESVRSFFLMRIALLNPVHDYVPV